MEIVPMTIPPNGDGYTRNEEVAMLRAQLATATKALEAARPFVKEPLSTGWFNTRQEALDQIDEILDAFTDGAKP